MNALKKVILYGGGVRGMLLCKANWESGSGIEIAAVTDSILGFRERSALTAQ